MRDISLAQDYNVYDSTGINKAHLQQINRLVQFCKNKGTLLFFLLAPNMGRKNNVVIQLFNGIDSSHRIELSDAKKYPELYSRDNSFDGKHLNLQGAKIFTKLLAEKFIEIKRYQDKKSQIPNRKS
jgi:hypothetical protein